MLSRLGPEPLSPEFDAAALARACKGKKTPLKVALLDQRVVAGLGNIYASEALHVAGLSPHAPGFDDRHAERCAAPGGGSPDRRDQAGADAARSSGPQTLGYRSSRFRVYDREGEPCLRAGCGGTIKRRTQAGRSTFYCPVCQR